jgi:hypothetical protein
VEEHDGGGAHLGMTPRYLDSRCHEALYEIDAGVNEVRDRPAWYDAGLEETSHRKRL